jgi:ferritin-like metal-binding protein YciE
MDKNDTSMPLKLKPGADKLKLFFMSHLNRIYCAKTHLVTRLPEMENKVNFSDLRQAIVDTRKDVEKQIARMQEIYNRLGEKISIESFNGMMGLVDDAFTAIHQQSGDPWLRDMSILFYLQNIESLETASFQALQVAAVKLKDDEIKRLLKENYTAAKTDRSLLLMLSAKYIMG